MPDRDLPNLGRGRSVADARKDARINRERHEAPNPRPRVGVGLVSMHSKVILCTGSGK